MRGISCLAEELCFRELVTNEYQVRLSKRREYNNSEYIITQRPDPSWKPKIIFICAVLLILSYGLNLMGLWCCVVRAHDVSVPPYSRILTSDLQLPVTSHPSMLRNVWQDLFINKDHTGEAESHVSILQTWSRGFLFVAQSDKASYCDLLPPDRTQPVSRDNAWNSVEIFKPVGFFLTHNPSPVATSRAVGRVTSEQGVTFKNILSPSSQLPLSDLTFIGDRQCSLHPLRVLR